MNNTTKLIITAGIILVANAAKADVYADNMRHQEDLLRFHQLKSQYEAKLMRDRARASAKALRKHKRNMQAYVASSQAEANLFATERRAFDYGIGSENWYGGLDVDGTTGIKW